MRVEMVTTTSFDNAPRRIIIQGQHIGSETLRHPFDILLVLLLIEGAGRINEQSVGFEGVPDVHQNLTLSLGTTAYRLRTPFVSGLMILAEHAFSRTGSVHQYAIEQMTAFIPEFIGGIMRYDGVSVAPFLDVLAEDKHPLAYHFVADEQTVFSQELTDERALATRRSAQVQYDRRGLQILLQRLLDKHGRRLLDIIAAGM